MPFLEKDVTTFIFLQKQAHLCPLERRQKELSNYRTSNDSSSGVLEMMTVLATTTMTTIMIMTTMVRILVVFVVMVTVLVMKIPTFNNTLVVAVALEDTTVRELLQCLQFSTCPQPRSLKFRGSTAQYKSSQLFVKDSCLYHNSETTLSGAYLYIYIYIYTYLHSGNLILSS